ncbi:MAG TPA: site-specific DNA-methyltransferase [Syntrophaceticus sp.]|nr:site-specific DNA-methyltransferase [Syntrophaceticus sp.]
MNYLTIDDAAAWASRFTKKKVTPSNISYLIQYGRIKKHSKSGATVVSQEELKQYYTSYMNDLQSKFTEKLGEDINWSLAFHKVKEKETTKHVHRLHPYKGKFIPQLVEYFLDQHTDDFKKEVFFQPGDIVLDPFCGSGTTLVQANELGIHSIGIDVSVFNCLMTKTKLAEYNLRSVSEWAKRIEQAIVKQSTMSKVDEFDSRLNDFISSLNKEHFPSPDYKYNLAQGLINEEDYVPEVMAQVNDQYEKLLQEYNFEVHGEVTQSSFEAQRGVTQSAFLNTWFADNVLQEAMAAKDVLEDMPSEEEKELLMLILSRTLRSCRTTPHYELERLNTPVSGPYYCYKHMKVCRPVLSMLRMYRRYAKDTIKRLKEFNELRTAGCFSVLAGDAREIDIFSEVSKNNQGLFRLLKDKKIQGIFTSPPYLGQLNYHEQHQYAYEFFGLKSHEDLEIGIADQGKGLQARKDYIEGVSDVLLNCSRFLADDCHIFVVANDTYDLYHDIAERSNLTIVQEFKRPVLNRTSRDRNAYGETIFYMKR